MSSEIANKGHKLREVNRANILNYESDSSEDIEGEQSADIMPNIKKSQ